ncbi:FAM45A [Cordylochernes scorpioides]|uniref:FAM45A n=1 Tax=Cordylochernes scorpioides TaxID=51811 RepID=A0ABY6KT83_9ARAC|nr:FAM45A [Cordylochernes scorpioides]
MEADAFAADSNMSTDAAPPYPWSGTLAEVHQPAQPVQLVKHYLDILVAGVIPGQDTPDYDVNQVISTFGLESILIYTAVLLKKRILVYHHKSEPLLNFLSSNYIGIISVVRFADTPVRLVSSALPALAWHRQDWNMLWPHADTSQLRGSHYIAGINMAGMESRTDLYDLYVNLPAVELTVAPHAKGDYCLNYQEVHSYI